MIFPLYLEMNNSYISAEKYYAVTVTQCKCFLVANSDKEAVPCALESGG